MSALACSRATAVALALVVLAGHAGAGPVAGARAAGRGRMSAMRPSWAPAARSPRAAPTPSGTRSRPRAAPWSTCRAGRSSRSRPRCRGAPSMPARCSRRWRWRGSPSGCGSAAPGCSRRCRPPGAPRWPRRRPAGPAPLAGRWPARRPPAWRARRCAPGGKLILKTGKRVLRSGGALSKIAKLAAGATGLAAVVYGTQHAAGWVLTNLLDIDGRSGRELGDALGRAAALGPQRRRRRRCWCCWRLPAWGSPP